MKPNTSNMTEEDYDLVEEWLDGGTEGCPAIGCEKCKDLFPEIPRSTGFSSYICPCQHHGYEYVSKAVTEIMEKKRALKK